MDVDLRLDFSNLERVVVRLLQDPVGLQNRSDRLRNAMAPFLGQERMLQQEAVLEEFASVLRPLARAHLNQRQSKQTVVSGVGSASFFAAISMSGFALMF